MVELAATVWRDFVTDGVPASGRWAPHKSVVREWGAYVEGRQTGSSLLYTFSSTTADADPGAGIFRFNNATPASVTAAYIDNVDASGATVSGILDSWDDSSNAVRGSLTLRGVEDPTVVRVYNVMGAVVDGTGYRKLTLAHVGGAGTPANGDSFLLGFTRAGDSAGSAATSIAALKALDTTTVTKATLLVSGRYGEFIWTLGDFSAAVTADTLNGIYIKADAVASTVGAWVRSYQGEVYVTWWGADPLYVSDSAPAFKAARDYLQTNSDYRGGVIYVPKGRYKVNSTIAFTAYNLVHNIFVRGDGPINTTLDFAGATVSTDSITFDRGAHFGVTDMMITGSRNDGISINPGATVGAAGSQNCEFHNLRIQQCVANGFAARNVFMLEMSNVWSTANGAIGFVFYGFHTTLEVRRCWASGNVNSPGWSINGACYSSFISCGSDANKWGWSIRNVAEVDLIACGAESNLRDGWILASSTASAAGIPTVVQDIKGLVFDSCFSIQNGQTPTFYASHINAVTADARPISFETRGNTSRVYTAGDFSMTLNGASGTVTWIKSKNFDVDGTTSIAGTVVTKEVVTTTDTQTLSGKSLITSAGTTALAPVTMTAGVNLTTPAAGASEFDGKVRYFTPVANQRNVDVIRQIVRVQGTPVALTNSITTAQPIFAAANDNITLPANTAYRFRAKIGLNTGATTHTTAFGFGGTATITSCAYDADATSAPNNTTPTATQRVSPKVATATVLTATSTAVRTDIRLEGIVCINAAGTIIPQVTFSAGPTGTCEVDVGSWFELEPIGTDVVQAVGNWS